MTKLSLFISLSHCRSLCWYVLFSPLYHLCIYWMFLLFKAWVWSKPASGHIRREIEATIVIRMFHMLRPLFGFNVSYDMVLHKVISLDGCQMFRRLLLTHIINLSRAIVHKMLTKFMRSVASSIFAMEKFRGEIWLWIELSVLQEFRNSLRSGLILHLLHNFRFLIIFFLLTYHFFLLNLFLANVWVMLWHSLSPLHSIVYPSAFLRLYSIIHYVNQLLTPPIINHAAVEVDVFWVLYFGLKPGLVV